MRTTITLEDDVREKIELEMRSQGKTFKDAINDLVRLGATSRPSASKKRKSPFKPMAMGFAPGITEDDLNRPWELLDKINGPWPLKRDQ